MDGFISISVSMMPLVQTDSFLFLFVRIQFNLYLIELITLILFKSQSSNHSFSICLNLPFHMSTFESLLNSSPQILNYFLNHTQNPQDSFKLAHQLLIEAIRNRIENQNTQLPTPINTNQKQFKSPKAHYNVAYVKHNRFLSPSQKKQVTPKVTEIIPVSPQKVFIFGKPKVKLDEGYGCPLHQENCEEYACNQGEQNSNYEKENEYPTDQNQCIPSKHNQDLPRQYEEYLSPKNKLKKKNQKQQISSNHTIGTIRSPKNKNHKDASNRITSQNAFGHNGSRINDSQNLSKVQSKIKELIQRDKRNRQIEKQVERQRQQILEIQQRQNRLFMMQKYQKNILKQETNIEQGSQNEVWKIKTSLSPKNMVIGGDVSETSQIEGSDDEFIVGYHGHQTLQQRSDCYDCEIERLRRRKEKAKLAIKSIDREERKRSKMFNQIVNKQQTMAALVGMQRYSQSQVPSHHSIRIG